MKFKNGKIVEATESELFSHYLKNGWDDIMSFTDYMKRCVENGTIIKEKKDEIKKETT